MPFGLTNAPATFQALMHTVFGPYLRKFVLVFFDDILIYSVSLEDHVNHLQIVFDVLRANRLFAKQSKCRFAQASIEYLGHVISGKGVRTDRAKVAAMINWPPPKSIKELRGFLGLTGYYRRFIKNFALISQPLTHLLKKGAFEWNENSTKSFEELKTAMTQAPVLALPNFSEPFVVEVDASGLGVGAVLSQNGRPIAFLSQALSPRHLGLSTYEKELIALLMAVEKWRHYLQSNHFVIKTDHFSLKYLSEQRITTSLQQKGITKLLGLSYEIQYKKGVENLAADALSQEGSKPRLSVMGLQLCSLHGFKKFLIVIIMMRRPKRC